MQNGFNPHCYWHPQAQTPACKGSEQISGVFCAAGRHVPGKVNVIVQRKKKTGARLCAFSSGCTVIQKRFSWLCVAFLRITTYVTDSAVKFAISNEF